MQLMLLLNFLLYIIKCVYYYITKIYILQYLYNNFKILLIS